MSRLERVDVGCTERAVEVAARLLRDSDRDETPRERRARSRLGRLLADPAGRELAFALADQILRIDGDRRAAERFAALVRETGIPRALGPLDRGMLAVGAAIAPRLPRLVMPLVRRRVIAETRGVVLPAGDPGFADYVRNRRGEDVRLNVNLLGEAILSDAEADRRLEQLHALVARDDVDYVSVKISAIVANLDVLAFGDGVARIAERLADLYRAGRDAPTPTFINLDMEEHRDLDLTVAAFTQVLGGDELRSIDAGIVLQAYLPDSHAVLARLEEFARGRRAAGGGRIKIRIVKGANLLMERAEAELHGWNQAPYATKAEVDASYKAMIDAALAPEWADALRIGVASHNLFDLAWAWTLATERDASDRVDIEMLEGMAPAQAREVHRLAGDLLLYAPVVDERELDASVAYLARRLDENTGPENFLRALFDLRPGDPVWDEQAERFRRSTADRLHVTTTSRRAVPRPRPEGFFNEPDTDLTLRRDREVILAALTSPNRDEPPRVTTMGEVDEIVQRAAAAATRWRATDLAERRRLVAAATQVMVAERAATLAVMADETGKVVREADPEVSEAIDFARYYSGPSLDLLAELAADGVSVAGRGPVAVAAPWNFPYAIAASGVFAALAAGNPVILKPAPEARRVAWWLVRQLWRGGIGTDVLQYAAIDDGPVGRHLITHDGIDTVVLTGAYDTARRFLDWKPDRRLLAETSGKNALVITAAADLDAAIADLVHSAFGHAGQKCSAASLAIVEASVYDDPSFRRRLRDAVASLVVGPAAEPTTLMGPVIAPPGDILHRALTTLEPGETWLVEPTQLDDGGVMWTPGVRLGVAAGSWFHHHEAFGPVLGVMRADDLDEAIELQNAVDYGLTGGIHTLDPHEVDRWLAGVEVGNAYVNRHVTGAVVNRQPFGGWKRSQVGPGAKAGGPGYVPLMCRFEGPLGVSVDEATVSYRHWWDTWFSGVHDPTALASERNALRYRPLARVLVRCDEHTDLDAVRLARRAAQVAGVDIRVIDRGELDDDELAGRIAAGTAGRFDRIRLLCDASDTLRSACHRADVAVDAEPICGHGRIELTHWVREQAISETAHRHGRPLSSTAVERLSRDERTRRVTHV